MAIALAELFWVGIVPCVAAVATFGLRRFVLRPEAVWATCVGGAIIVGQFGLVGRHGWQSAIDSLLAPHEASDWLPWLVLVATGLSVLAAYASRPWKRPIAALACLFAIAVPARLLAGSIYVTSRWSAEQKVGMLLLLSAVLAAMWYLLAAGRANGQMRVRGGLLIVVAVGMAITVTLSGSFSYGELCGVVAAALSGTVLASIFSGATGSRSVGNDTDGLSSSAGVLTVALGSLILLTHYYVLLNKHDVPYSALISSLLAAAVVAAAGRLPTGWPRQPAAQAALRAALCLAPLATALALAAWAATADPYAV
jgi:hypothetical protein